MDFDGVIADSLEATCTATLDVLKGRGFARMASKTSMLALFDGNCFEGLGRVGVPPAVIEAIDDRFADIASTGAVKPFPAMPSFITRFADCDRIVVITSNRTDIVRSLLSSWGICGISDVVGGDREQRRVRKIESALLGYAAHSRCWLVGDTVGDILEGRQAGIRTMAVARGWHSEERLARAEPDLVVRTPQELLAHFQQRSRCLN